MADFLSVQEVLKHLSIKNSMLAAEFGCGSAHFGTTLAKKIPKGRVYALDIQEEKLSALKARAIHEHVKNTFTIHCDLEEENGSKLQDNMLDVVLITNVLFQVENKNIILKEAKRVLKKGGQMLVADWLKPGPFSPKEGMVSPDEVKRMAGALGFSLKKEFSAGDYHYGLVFIK